jgi:hypothetical protein
VEADGYDCVVISADGTGTLVVKGQIMPVARDGTVIKPCNEARFDNPVVSVHYLSDRDRQPLPKSYISSADDRGKLFSERIRVAASITDFMKGRQWRRRQVPAAQLATSGVFSIDKTSFGDSVVLVDPFLYDPSSKLLMNKLPSNVKDDGNLSLLKLKGRVCGISESGQVDCQTPTPTGVPTAVGFLIKDVEANRYDVGKTYRLVGLEDRTVISATMVPSVYLKEFAQARYFEPTGPSERLDKLLIEMTYARFVEDEKKVEAAAAALKQAFPQLVRD